MPTAPGGAIDTAARVMGEKMQAKWGKPVVIENRPGAAMRVGAEAVHKLPNDGYTLLVAHDGTMAMNPLVFPNLPTIRKGILSRSALVASIPEAVMVNVAVPANSIAELVALARKEPGQLTHASGGSATLLSLELLKAMAGIDIRSIPYRGGSTAVTATIAGETNMIIADLATGRLLQSDRVRPLAVTSLARSKKYPKIPTVNELGVPGTRSTPGWASRAGRNAQARSVGHRGRDQGGRCHAGRARTLRVAGANVRSGTAEEMRQVLATDVAKWAKLVTEKHITFGQ